MFLLWRSGDKVEIVHSSWINKLLPRTILEYFPLEKFLIVSNTDIDFLNLINKIYRLR